MTVSTRRQATADSRHVYTVLCDVRAIREAVLVTNSMPRQSAVKAASIHERVLRCVRYLRRYLVRFFAGRTAHAAISKDLAARLRMTLTVEKGRDTLSGGGDQDCSNARILRTQKLMNS